YRSYLALRDAVMSRRFEWGQLYAGGLAGRGGRFRTCISESASARSRRMHRSKQCSYLFDHRVGEGEQLIRYRKTEGLRGREVNEKTNFVMSLMSRVWAPRSLSTASVPILPPGLGRLSTINGCPSLSESC